MKSGHASTPGRATLDFERDFRRLLFVLLVKQNGSGDNSGMKRVRTRIADAIIEITKGCWHRLVESDARILAGSLAFATTISIVPLLAVSLSVFHWYGGFEPLLQRVEPFLLNKLVAGAGNELASAIRGVIHRVHSTALGVGGVIGLLFASMNLFWNVEEGVVRIWGSRSKRPLWLRFVVYWAIMFVGPLLFAAGLGVIGSSDITSLRYVPKGTIGFAFTFFGLIGIYKFVPARNVRLRAAFWSALIAAAGITLAQEFYFEITKTLLSYNKVYGSLASVPIFLLWILVLWWIVLFGVALCKALHSRVETEGRLI